MLVFVLTFVLVFVLTFVLVFLFVFVLVFVLIFVLLFLFVLVLLFPFVVPVLLPGAVPGGALVRFPGLNTPGGNFILTGPIVVFVGVPLVLFCPPGFNCFSPGKVLIVSWFVGLVLFCCPPPGARFDIP